MKSVKINPLAVIPRVGTYRQTFKAAEKVQEQHDSEPPVSEKRRICSLPTIEFLPLINLSSTPTMMLKTHTEMQEESDPEKKVSIERERQRAANNGRYSLVFKDGVAQGTDE